MNPIPKGLRIATVYPMMIVFFLLSQGAFWAPLPGTYAVETFCYSLCRKDMAGKLNAGYTVLLFYQGGCPRCEDALIALSNGYKVLKEKGVRVIAVSGDGSEPDFEKKIPYHQWPDNYCDFPGMDGANFKNYAVLGIPTLYLLDSRGVVLKKTAMMDEVLKAVESR